MKRLLFIGIIALSFFLFSYTCASAWFLVNDPLLECVGGTYDIEVNGAVAATLHPAEIDGSIRYDIDYLGSGQQIFRTRCIHSSGWGSAWSLPLDATKPDVNTGHRIVE